MSNIHLNYGFIDNLQGFKYHKINDITYLTIKSFTQTNLVKHAFTTRLGGVSRGSYAELNLALHVGDIVDDVLDNRRRVCRIFGIDLKNLVCGEQVHGDKVMLVTREHIGCGALSLSDVLPAVDALITKDRGVALMSFYVDCVPLFFLDPLNKAVGLAHAGWKGTAKRIAVKVVENMSRFFGSKPGNMIVGIGPSIGSCCYLVDESVKNYFLDYDVLKKCGQKWHLDLKKSNKYMLMDVGVKENNIAIVDVCTCCKNDIFFSYRTSKKTGRMAALICLD